MSVINVEKLNEVHLRVYSDDLGIEAELSEHFKFEVPGARFMPLYKAKLWDGQVYLYNSITRTLYVGLISHLQSFAKNNGYKLEYSENVFDTDDFSIDIISKFANDLDLYGRGKPIEIRDYQINAVHHALNNKRCILLSPTGSGKSLILYTLIRCHLEQNRKVLLVTPSVSLVEQMYSDFEDYSSQNKWSVEDHCQKLYSGFSKLFESNVLITTWQSIFRQPKEWFDQFDVILGDECLHPDSQILMHDGTTKRIIDIKVGDVVKTVNEITNDIENKPVVKLHKNISSEKMYKVTLKSGKKIKITGNHKVYTNEGWKRIDSLRIGSKIKIYK